MGPAAQTETSQEGHHTKTLSSRLDDISTPEPFLAGAVHTVSIQEGENPKEGPGTVSLVQGVSFESLHVMPVLCDKNLMG